MHVKTARRGNTSQRTWTRARAVRSTHCRPKLILSTLRFTTSSCLLLQAYDFGRQYLLNMHFFDSTRNLSSAEFADLPKSESFFGPLEPPNSHAKFFLSLAQQVEYDIEKYQYEESEGSFKVGHIFGLLSSRKLSDLDRPNSSETLTSVKERHRVNLGSILKDIKVDLTAPGSVTLEYGDGDSCDDRTYRTSVVLMCNKTAASLASVEISPDPQNR